MRRILPAVIAAATLLAALPALAFERVELTDKDVVLGAITEELGTHEYPIDVPRDATFTLSLPKQKDSRLQGAMFVLDSGYRDQRLFLIGRRKVQLAAPLSSSQRLRAIVQGVNGSTGNYVLKPRIKVARSYKIRGKRSDLSPPGQIVFGALPGYDVELKVSWRGPDPVTIGSFTGPDGADLISDDPGKLKRSSFKQAGYRTAAFGDHRVVLDIPPSAGSWVLKVVQKARTAGRTLNLRPGHALVPELDLSFAQLRAAYFVPLIRVNGEFGAGNEIVCTGDNTAPAVIAVLGEATEPCSFAALEQGSTPTLYGLVCEGTHAALFTVGERDESRRILDYVIDPLESPGGTGTTSFDAFTYTSGNRLTGWTEVRTFDTSGNTHTLVVSDILQTGNFFTYTVRHTRPDGTTRRYDFLPFN